MVTVGEAGFLYISLRNLTSNVQRVKEGTLLGNAVPVMLVHKAIPQVASEQQTENQSTANFVCKVDGPMKLDTASDYSSSSEFEFLLSTDPSDGLSEHEKRKRTGPALLAPIPDPEAQFDEVQNLWGSTARDTLDKLLQEFDEAQSRHW